MTDKKVTDRMERRYILKGNKKIKMIFLIIAAAVVLLLLALIIMVAAFWVTGRGRIEQYMDENGNVLEGSIAEKTYIDVNGRKNGLIIRGKSDKNPVLLFISGGPGVPQYWLNDAYKEKYPNRIEDEFTVCWWDYIGEGLSYDASVDPSEITMEKLTDDAIVVCDYLKERFGVDRIYLMAHSGGTMLGMNLAIEKPEYFYCYFAMGQVANPGWDRHEAGYYFIKSKFEKEGNKKLLNKLESMVEQKDGHVVLKSGYNEGHWENMLLKAGCATTKEMTSDVTGIFFPMMLSECYTFGEKIDYWKGKALLAESPYSKTSGIVYEPVKISIPVIFISGTYDYTTPITNVKTLCDMLNEANGEGAEVVHEFYEFKNSAHSPLWEENEAVLEVMKKYVR